MIALTCFAVLAVFQLAASSQNPPLTQCPGEDHPIIEVTSVKIENAELGKTVNVHTKVVVHQPTSTNPVLQLAYARQSGGPATCIPSILPCDLKLCDGTTPEELELNQEWGNQCPIPPGTYTAHLNVYVPDSDAAKAFVGDGKLIVTMTVVDNGVVENCVSFPVIIKT